MAITVMNRDETAFYFAFEPVNSINTNLTVSQVLRKKGNFIENSILMSERNYGIKWCKNIRCIRINGLYYPNAYIFIGVTSQTPLHHKVWLSDE